jgi:C_GCAxxG_C_C family probable redox protein
MSTKIKLALAPFSVVLWCIPLIPPIKIGTVLAMPIKIQNEEADMRVKSRVNDALVCFDSARRFLCSQAILSTYCEDFGLYKESALKLSCGLGAGMGRLGHTCGAVTGAYLVIGLKHGKYLPEDNESKEKTFALVQEFERRFLERNPTTICRDILGVDLIHGDKQTATERVNERCPKVVQDAAEILEALLFS